MVTSANTVDKASAPYIASEIYDVQLGFRVLHEYLHGLMGMETKDISEDYVAQMLWAAGKIATGIDEALEHAEALDEASRKVTA
jgi:hypothetical protein